MRNDSHREPEPALPPPGARHIEHLQIRLLALPLVEPFRAAHGVITLRELAVVRVDTDVGVGWGECSALPEPTYTHEYAADAFVRLRDILAPAVVGQRLRPDAVLGALPDAAAWPMASAAIEMAVLDAALRADGRSLAAHLGVAGTDVSVRAGAAVGLGSIADVVGAVRRQASLGFERVKLKIEPGHDLAVVEAVLGAEPEVEVQVDGNGSFGPEHVGLLRQLSRSGITAIEQPFAPDDLASAARLTADAAVPVIADEAAPDLEAIRSLADADAIGGVSIKPPRVGGLAAAVAIHDLCVSRSLAATAGGMIECGLGRHALAAVAALPGFTITGDLSPASRWMAADPWPDLHLGGPAGPGRLAVPQSDGVAPDPDPDLLDRLTVDVAEVRPG